MPEQKTHFEQVPVELVKKIAREDAPVDEGTKPVRRSRASHAHEKEDPGSSN
jgi:hypothetical protein